MGALAVPDLFIIIDPKNVSPLLNNTESPGRRVLKKAFNLLIVFQGEEEFCAWIEVLESSPETEEK